MKIIISTENGAKLRAVGEVLGPVWPDAELIGEKFPSGVPEQPLSEEEGIEGAFNRANKAKTKYPDAEYFVGMEGYVDTNRYGMFLAGAVVILDRDGRMGVGISAKIPLPETIRKDIGSGKELGPLIRDLTGDSLDDIRHRDGTNGILSKGLYSRVDEFKDATVCALARFLSPEFYD